MGGQGHLVRGDHVLPGQMADLCHVKAVGAGDLTLPAEGAGVHGLVQLMVAHDDLGVVEDLPAQQGGVFFIVFQIGTALFALVTVALYAPPGLFHGLFPGVALTAGGDAHRVLNLFKAGIEPGLRRSFLAPGVARVQLLGQPVHREGGSFGGKGAVQHTAFKPHDQLLFRIDHQRLIADRLREEPQCRGL